jgi:flagellar L-ring protein precursor FlgH
MSRLLLLISICSCFLSTTILADSLWNKSSRSSFFGTAKKQIQIGDIITIEIEESSSAVHEATTRTSKQSSMGSEFTTNWDQVANLLGNETIRKNHELGIGGDDEYRGLGQTARKSKVTATISAIVTEILDSGKVYILGEHKIKVNNEVETIRISGIIDPAFIRPNNIVRSNQIAKAEISVIGAGVIGAKQSPGILTKMFNWLF